MSVNVTVMNLRSIRYGPVRANARTGGGTFWVREIELVGTDGSVTVSAFSDVEDALHTPEERSARMRDPSYVPTVAEAVADLPGFVDGMTETREIHHTGGDPVGTAPTAHQGEGR